MTRRFVKFCIMQAAYWSYFASLPGYITAYMLSKGMSASTLGILLACNMALAFAGSMIWGRFVDRKQANKRFFIAGTATALTLGILIFLFADRTPVLFVIYPLFGFMMGPIATTLDSWAIAGMHQVEAGAKSRTFGTLGYAVTMLLSGQIIRQAGYRWMPFMAAGFILIAIMVALTQPEVEPVTSSGEGQIVKKNPKQLLHNGIYILLIGVVFFVGMSIAPINNMKVLVFENVGGDVSFLGWDSFIGCLIQSPFLILAGRMKKIRAEYRLAMGALASLSYVLLVYFAKAPAMVIAGTIMTNISFGLLFPTMREITERNVPAGLRTTAHSLVDVAYGSVAGMIASSWSGTVMQHAGTGAMTRICMAFETAALVLCSVIIVVSRRKQAHKCEACKAAA